ncbi:MAG: phosphatase PAP2 family protein [Methanobacteriota archaeon]|nr:MAG: phosphatase PAP2 family protein [Euryarchaeota archaeon]
MLDGIVLLLAHFIDKELLFFPFLLLLAFFLDRRHTLLIVLASMVLVLVLKPIFAVQRVCAGDALCTSGFGFPSGHATVVAALAYARYGRKEFLPLLLFALFVGYTRVFLGFHIWTEVFAGFALAIFLLELGRLSWLSS